MTMVDFAMDKPLSLWQTHERPYSPPPSNDATEITCEIMNSSNGVTSTCALDISSRFSQRYEGAEFANRTRTVVQDVVRAGRAESNV